MRSLISLPAGAAGMPLGRFVVLTAAGSAIWNSLLIGGGVLLGTQWQTVEEHIDVINDLIYTTIGCPSACSSCAGGHIAADKRGPAPTIRFCHIAMLAARPPPNFRDRPASAAPIQLGRASSA